MADYNLKSNESLMLKCEQVQHYKSKSKSPLSAELLLTSQNIVVITKKGLFGNSTNVETFPLKQITIFNDKPQIKLVTLNKMSNQVEVYFAHSMETFGFIKKKDAMNWMDHINQLLVGKPADFTSSDRSAIPGTELLAGTLKSTVDVFKGTFGIKTKTSTEVAPATHLTQKCISCRAPLSGASGQKRSCDYCGTEQILG